MATTVVVNGSNYSVSAVGEKNWGQNTSDLLIALAVATPGNSGYINYVSVASSPISVVSGRTYLVNTAATRQLNLPAAAANAFFHVKDVSGLAGTNNITIHRVGTEQIDGVAADKTLALDNGAWMLLSDGTNWFTYNDDNRRVMLANAQTITGAKTFSGAVTTFNNSGSTAISASGDVLIFRTEANSADASLYFRKIRVASIVQSGDQIFGIYAQGWDGAAYREAASIRAYVAATPGASDMPGRLDFYTTPDGSATPALAMRIDQSQIITIPSTANQLVIGTTRTVTISAPTPASASRTVTIPDLTGDYSVVGTIGAQTIAGAKTFSSQIAITATTNQFLLSTISTGLVTITAASHGTSRTYTIPDAGAAASFVMTEVAQTINGVKTFGNQIQAALGSVGTPAISTSTDNDTGFRFLGGGLVGFVENGADIIYFGGSSTLQVPDGVVGSPGVRFVNDSDTGFWRPGSNQINISLGGNLAWNYFSTGTADDQPYIPAYMSGGGGTAANALEIITQSTTGVAGAKTILTMDYNGYLLMVAGTDGTNDFVDIVTVGYYGTGGGGGAAIAIASRTNRGTPAVRTYAHASNGALTLAMASGTYTVRCSGFGLGNR